MAFAERVRRARRRRCCEARFSAAALSRASSSAAARAFASALGAVPSESVDVRTGTAPKLPRHAASSTRRSAATTCVEIKFYGAFVLNLSVDIHAIDAPPAR